MDASIVSREQLQRAYDMARAAGADREMAIAIVVNVYAMSTETVA